MLGLSIILILAPTLFFLLDQLNITLFGGALTFSIGLGIIGINLLGFTQRHRWQRTMGVTAVGLLALVGQYVFNYSAGVVSGVR